MAGRKIFFPLKGIEPRSSDLMSVIRVFSSVFKTNQLVFLFAGSMKEFMLVF